MHTPLNHLACIMDGNRRYAKATGKLAMLGHADGAKTVQMVIQFCLKNSIPYLSLYTFSLENFKRSPTEVTYLFELLLMQIEAHGKQLHDNNIRIQFIGDRTRFPKSMCDSITDIENITALNTTLHVFILFCYGGRQEIVAAVRTIAQEVAAGTLSPEAINEELIKQHLWTGNIPDPDLIIRTGGVQRLSNFLLYQSPYSELYFTNTYWPAFTQEELSKAVDNFYNIKRNFGS